MTANIENAYGTQTTQEASTLFQRIASGNEATLMKCFAFLQKYNMPPPSNRFELSKMLAEACIVHGDSACRDLAAIHPDAEFIVENSAIGLPLPKNDTGAPAKKHCDCGCNAHKNDTGTGSSIVQPVTQWMNTAFNQKDIVLYVLVFLTVAFVFHKLTQK